MPANKQDNITGIRARLQFATLMFSLAILLIVYFLGYLELGIAIETASTSQAVPLLLEQLHAQRVTYLVDATWQSLVMLGLVFLLSRIMIRKGLGSLVACSRSLESISKGDLTTEMPLCPDSESSSLERTSNIIQQQLTTILRTVDECGKRLGQSAYQVAAISHEISEACHNERNSCDDVASASTLLENASRAVMSSAESAAARAVESEHKTRDGMQMVRQSIGEMDGTVADVSRASREVTELTEAAEQIVNIIGTIRAIAEQTNLLALNAAIEAARAGEQGRGFAVVADEVRGLAGRTTAATGEISDIINRLKQQVDTVSNTMQTVVEGVHTSKDNVRNTEEIIQFLTDVVSETARSNREIRDASKEQLDNFVSLQFGLDKLFGMLNSNRSKVSASAAISEDIEKASGQLGDLLQGFSFTRIRDIQSAAHEKRRAPRLQNTLRVQIKAGNEVIEAVSLDFSMTGMRLRTVSVLPDTDKVTLQLYVPNEDMQAYARQAPVSIDAGICWQKRQDDGASICGVEFAELAAGQAKALQYCFEYFEKIPYYSDGSFSAPA